MGKEADRNALQGLMLEFFLNVKVFSSSPGYTSTHL